MTRLLQRAVIATMLALPVAAAAQAPGTGAAPDPGQPSPEVAQTLSGLGVAAPIGLTGLAIVFQDLDLFKGSVLLLIPGPSAGYIYGGQRLRGLASAGVRTVALATSLAGAFSCWDGCGTGGALVGGAVFLGGLWWMLSSAFRDAAHVRSDVQRANARRPAPVTPTLHVDGGQLQLRLAFRF